MIDTEVLPSISQALEIAPYMSNIPVLQWAYILHEIPLQEDFYNVSTALCAGYIAGVRHERHRQRQRATQSSTNKRKAARHSTSSGKANNSAHTY